MRYLRLRLALNFICKKNSKALSFTSIVSIIGISFGVSAFLVVITVLNSFQSEMKNMISSMNPNIMIFSEQGISNVTSFEEELHSLISQPIIKTNPFIYNESIMGLGSEASAVYIRAIEGTHSASANDFAKYIKPKNALNTLDVESPLIDEMSRSVIPAQNPEKLPHVILGSKLAKNLDAKIGDTVTLMTFGQNSANKMLGVRYNKFYVTGIINIGLSQYDNQYVLMNFVDGRKLFGAKNWASAVEVKLKNPNDALAISKDLNDKIPYTAIAWQQIDKGLFEQIERDGTAVKLIVLIISFVAGFNIVVTLSLTVIDRSRQIALLRSLGAKQADIIRIFVYCGLILGIMGSALGLGVGYLILKIFSGLNLGDLQEFYYLEKIPVDIDLPLVLIAFFTAILLSFAGALYPAWKATRVSPLLGLTHGG